MAFINKNNKKYINNQSINILLSKNKILCKYYA